MSIQLQAYIPSEGTTGAPVHLPQREPMPSEDGIPVVVRFDYLFGPQAKNVSVAVCAVLCVCARAVLSVFSPPIHSINCD